LVTSVRAGAHVQVYNGKFTDSGANVRKNLKFNSGSSVIAIFTVRNGSLQVLLAKRGVPPGES
jgi:hypothetical protein